MMRSGLRNNGNECFINSALQCLAISPLIKDFLANYSREDEKLIEVICKFKLGKFKADEINIECERILKEHSDILDANEKHILSKIAKNSSDIFIYIAFKQMIINMNTNRGTVLNNSRFLSIIKEIADDSGFHNLFSGSQEDPHELLVYLFDKLHSAKSTKVNIDIPGNINDMNEILQAYVKHFKARYENDYSYFVKNFYYYIVNCVECNKCKNKSLEMCPNDIMTVSVPNELAGGGITIYDCLNDLFKIENFEGYKCEKCGNKDENRIEKKILTKAKTLIIKIKRYELVGKMLRKISKMINYPLSLDIKNYYCGEGIDTKYELYGVINHIGNLNGGHYYSFIRNTEEDGKFSDNWQCCNDERVSAISQEEAFSSTNAYILFYTLVN